MNLKVAYNIDALNKTSKENMSLTAIPNHAPPPLQPALAPLPSSTAPVTNSSAHSPDSIQMVASEKLQSEEKAKREKILANLKRAREDKLMAVKLTEQNECIRDTFSHFSEYVRADDPNKFTFDHKYSSSLLIESLDDSTCKQLKTYSHLQRDGQDKMRDTIVVFGAQIYECDSKLYSLESLHKFLPTLNPTGKLWAVDFDPVSLSRVSKFLKESRVVTHIQDLSGLCRKVQEIIDRTLPTASNFMDAICLLFERESKNINDESDRIRDLQNAPVQAFPFLQNGSADVVISSLVATQLPCMVGQLVIKHLVEHYKCYDLMDLPDGQTLIDRFNAASRMLKLSLTTNHVTRIFALCKPAGYVYFADTLGGTVTMEMARKNERSLEQDLCTPLHISAQSFSSACTTREWVWVQHTSSCFFVKGGWYKKKNAPLDTPCRVYSYPIKLARIPRT